VSPLKNPPIPAIGEWGVDPGASHARFTAATLGGLVKTPGRFRELSGNLTIGDDRAHGVLTIDVASIDTGNRLRDGHLRRRDFFHVSKHPELRYELHTLAPAEGEKLHLEGQLTVAGTRTALPLDVDLRIHSDALVEISAHTQVDRVLLGVRGARGMVPRTVELDIRVTLKKSGG
jgi:polyisoprenoid-binding protein YceI